MRSKTRHLVVPVLASAVLAACNGGDSTSINPPGAASHHAVRYAKTTTIEGSYQDIVEQLYIAYFGRPADPNGLANFEAALAAASAPKTPQGLAAAYATNPVVKSLIDSFGQSAESQTLYGTGSTGDFVNAIFTNVIGRAPQTSGAQFWTNAIDNGTLSRGDAALAIMAGALTNSTAQGLLDTQLIAGASHQIS